MSNIYIESFFRATLQENITDTQLGVVRVSNTPTLTSGLLTIDPNTSVEEIVEYNGVDTVNNTITLTKRGILPSALALTIDWTDYNNPSHMFSHSVNKVIRGDINNIHINQLSTFTNPNTDASTSVKGVTRLSVAPVSPTAPIAVGDNDPRLIPTDSSNSTKWVVKLSVAPTSPTNPIAVWDNDPRMASLPIWFASTSVFGITKLATTPAVSWTPIAVWDNDVRVKKIYCQSYMSGWDATTVPDSTETTIKFHNFSGVNATWMGVTNDRITIATDWQYIINANYTLTSTWPVADKAAILKIKLNWWTAYASSLIPLNIYTNVPMNCSTVLDLFSGDYLEVSVTQNSGSSATVANGVNQNLTVTKI